MTECIFKRGVTCEDVEDDEISGWLIKLAAKVVVLVLAYNDDGDGNSGRKSKNLDNEAVLINAPEPCKNNKGLRIKHVAFQRRRLCLPGLVFPAVALAADVRTTHSRSG